MAISTAVDPSAIARTLGIATIFKDLRGAALLLPQRIAVIGQGNTAATYATTKRQVTTAAEVATLYGSGSPLHLAALKLLPANGDGVGTIPVTVYPLVDDAAGVAAAGDITPSGSATSQETFKVVINNIDSEEFVIPVGATVAAMVTLITDAINANVDMPVLAVDSVTKCDVTAKWEGTTGNDLFIEVVGVTTAGVSFAVTQPVTGAANPSIDAALAQVGDVWETMFLNCLDIVDSVALGDYDVFGEGRWGALTRKPCVVFTGNTEAVVATAVTVPDARKADRTNVQLVAPGSNDLPFVVAARQLARIAVVANSNPPHDYGSQDATGLVPGLDSDQWTHAERDLAVKAGSSTIEVKDGVINISDVVTMFHPDGDPTPAYRYVVDIVKLQNVIFNLSLEFNTAKWDGAPLIPDDQPTANPDAKKPKDAIAAVAAIIDNLALEAILSDPEAAKKATVAEIDSGNPKRLNITMQVQLSGNVNIISLDLGFGFFFGEPQIF